MKIFNFIVEASFKARQSWTHIKLHTYDYYRHFVWGKITILFGQPHLVPISVCNYCDEELSAVGAGDEIWDYCESCGAIEPEHRDITTEEYERIHG